MTVYTYILMHVDLQVALFSIWFIEFLAFIGLVIGIVLKETKASGSIDQACTS